jgi:hypothetical protein
MRSICHAIMVMPVLMTQLVSYSFAGLSPRTTMSELKIRYPGSLALDGLMHLTEGESHDHISTIAVSSDGVVRTLTVTFEREHANGPTYPECDKVVASLTGRYGAPGGVVDAPEERAQNRRFEWRTRGETMTLSCFRMPRQPMYAERLAIASVG